MLYQIWLEQSTVTHPVVCFDKVVNQQFAACSGSPHDDNHLTSIPVFEFCSLYVVRRMQKHGLYMLFSG